MSNTIIKKTIVNFNTKNNTNTDISSSPYNNCILKMRESYKNVKSISLKSAELILPNTILIDDDCIVFSVLEDTQFDFNIPNLITLQKNSTLTLITLIQSINDVINDSSLTFNIQLQIDDNNMVKFIFSNCLKAPKIIINKLSTLLGYNDNDNARYHYINPYYDGYVSAISYSPINFSPIYYNIYISNLPCKSHMADGSNSTFKIPTTVSKAVAKIPTLSNIFYNEESNYKQTVYLEDKTFILNSLTLYLYDNSNNNPIKLNTQINYSFSLEIEYEANF